MKVTKLNREPIQRPIVAIANGDSRLLFSSNEGLFVFKDGIIRKYTGDIVTLETYARRFSEQGLQIFREGDEMKVVF